MEKSTRIRHTIRFRRWSRKAYATFASIGQCVTIGFLRKGIADRSLGKQKAKGAAGHTGRRTGDCHQRNTEEWETDTGIPGLRNMIFLKWKGNEEAMNFFLSNKQMLCAGEKTGEAKKRILRNRYQETRFIGNFAVGTGTASIR